MKIVLPIATRYGKVAMMKVEKISVSIPVQALKFARRRVTELSKIRGSRVSLSAYLAERIAQEQEAEIKRNCELSIMAHE